VEEKPLRTDKVIDIAWCTIPDYGTSTI